MRVAHVHHAETHRFAADLRGVFQSVVRFAFLRQKRDFRRPQTRPAHVHRHQTVVFQLRYDNALRRFHTDFPLAGQTTVGNKTGKAARAVAALLHFAAVGIENAVAEIGIGRRGFFHQQKLVETDTRVPVRPRGNRRGGRIEGLRNAVDHDKVVAQAVHFGEFQRGGHIRLSCGAAVYKKRQV